MTTTKKHMKAEANYAAMRVEWDAAHEEHVLVNPTGRIEFRSTDLDAILERAWTLAKFDAGL